MDPAAPTRSHFQHCSAFSYTSNRHPYSGPFRVPCAFLVYSSYVARIRTAGYAGEPGCCTSVPQSCRVPGHGALERICSLPILHPLSGFLVHTTQSIQSTMINHPTPHPAAFSRTSGPVIPAQLFLATQPNVCDTDRLRSWLSAPSHLNGHRTAELRLTPLDRADSVCYLGRTGLQSGNVRVAKELSSSSATASLVRAWNAPWSTLRPTRTLVLSQPAGQTTLPALAAQAP